ncbi:hypothetical protein ACWDSJ_12005 [Nocardia sp. NPDC003482]
MRYRLAVVAPRTVDVVRHAGGWLFDRSSAGWEVTVLVPGCRDVRPLEILGATVLDLEQSLAGGPHEVWPDVIAVAAESYRADPRVREGVLACLDDGRAEITVWGDALPAELDARVATAEHRVSVAARAFKACALTAAGCGGEAVGRLEVFRTGAMGRTESENQSNPL